MYMRCVQNQNSQSLISCFWHLSKKLSQKSVNWYNVNEVELLMENR